LAVTSHNNQAINMATQGGDHINLGMTQMPSSARNKELRSACPPKT